MVSLPHRAHALSAVLLVASAFNAPAQTQSQSAAEKRPMTFLDVQQMRQVGSPTPSPDGRWMLYTVSLPDWKEGKRQTDIFLVSLQQGVASTRQMTFTKDKNETSPQWAQGGDFFVFQSNREAPESAQTRNQLYLMRPDGGEAQRITDAKEGVSDFAFSRDGRTLVYRSGKSGEEQLYRLPVGQTIGATAEQITRHPTGVGSWQWAPDSKRIYFVSRDTADPDEPLRREKKFTVNIRNADTPLSSLWALELDDTKTKRLTEDSTYSVSGITISRDGKWISFRGQSSDRYKRNITQENIYSDLYLLNTASGKIERLTKNDEVSESAVSFSPDSKWIAFSAADDLEKYSMTNGRVYVRAVTDTGKPFRKLGASFDGDVSVGFWSKDGSTIYFNEGIRATNQFFALDVDRDTVTQITKERASLSVDRDDVSGVLLLTYADGTTPPTTYTVSSIDQVATPGVVETAHRRQPPGARLRAGRGRGDYLALEGWNERRRRAREAGELSCG